MTTASDPAVAKRPASAGHAHVHPNLALAVILTAQLMVILDVTIVNIALPSMRTALHFSPTGLAWVLNAYTLTFGGLLLLGGRSGDLFGRRRMFIIGVLIFAIASLLGGLAWDKGWLLAMRALQGVGGAIASPTALALVTTTFEEGPARNRAFGLYAAVSGAGAAIGLIMGGILVDTLSWRWVLFVNAPIGIALAIATPRVLAESERNPGHFALADALTATGGVAALVYGFINAANPAHGWHDATTIISFAIAVVLLVTFIVIESRSEEPLIPLRLFANRSRVGAYVVMLVTGAGIFAMFYFMTQFIQNVLDFSPLQAGFAFLPVSATIVVTAQIVARLVAKVPTRFLLATGSILVGTGLFWMSTLEVGSSYAAHVLPCLLLVAAGMGFTFVPITLAAVADVEPKDTGVASAMLNVVQQVGGTIGLSALVTVFGTASKNYAVANNTSPISPAAFTHGADMAFRMGSVLAAVGAIVALTFITIRQSDVPPTPVAAG
jgi:EmrB/QacA subfamily drug resistance transporter